VVAFVEKTFRRITGSGRSERALLTKTVEGGGKPDNSGAFYRRRRFAELTRPHQTS